MRSLISGSTIFLLSIISVSKGSGYYNGAKWHCGINRLTETVSEWLAKPFDYHGVNQCCHAHDEHYYHHTLSRDDADRVFCNCLEQNANWFVRNLIEPIFCKSVQTYAIWQKVTQTDPWTEPITTTTLSTTTKKSFNYYLELIRQRKKEQELKKQIEEREREAEEERAEKFRKEWYLFQQYQNQKKLQQKQPSFEWSS